MDAAEFKVREAAGTELLKMGAAGLPPLKALKGELSAEVRAPSSTLSPPLRPQSSGRPSSAGSPSPASAPPLRCDKLEFDAGEPVVVDVEYRVTADAARRFVPVTALSWDTPSRIYSSTAAQATVVIKQLSGTSLLFEAARRPAGKDPTAT